MARDPRVLVGWPFPFGFGLDGRLLLARRGRICVKFIITSPRDDAPAHTTRHHHHHPASRSHSAGRGPCEKDEARAGEAPTPWVDADTEEEQPKHEQPEIHTQSCATPHALNCGRWGRAARFPRADTTTPRNHAGTPTAASSSLRCGWRRRRRSAASSSERGRRLVGSVRTRDGARAARRRARCLGRFSSSLFPIPLPSPVSKRRRGGAERRSGSPLSPLSSERGSRGAGRRARGAGRGGRSRECVAAGYYRVSASHA